MFKNFKIIIKCTTIFNTYLSSEHFKILNKIFFLIGNNAAFKQNQQMSCGEVMYTNIEVDFCCKYYLFMFYNIIFN